MEVKQTKSGLARLGQCQSTNPDIPHVFQMVLILHFYFLILLVMVGKMAFYLSSIFSCSMPNDTLPSVFWIENVSQRHMVLLKNGRIFERGRSRRCLGMEGVSLKGVLRCLLSLCLQMLWHKQHLPPPKPFWAISHGPKLSRLEAKRDFNLYNLMLS